MTMHLPTVPEEPWMEDALCAQIDSGDVFFPEPGASAHEAKLICELCLVQVECLRYALRRKEMFGVWGGRTARERRRMERNRYTS